MKSLSGIALFVVLLLWVPNLSAQSIPVDIPDTPGESPADRERQKRAERYHETWSRFFGTTMLSASPALTGPGTYFDTVFEGGYELAGGDALILMLGARSNLEVTHGTVRSFIDEPDGGGSLFALGYEIGLVRFSGHPILSRSKLNLAVGGFLGDVDMLYLEVSPRYVLRANQYWSFPVGLKLTTSLLGRGADPIGTVGLALGVRRHFGQRDVLE